MDYQTIKWTLQDGIGVITLDRPSVRNALNAQMRAEIVQAVRVAEESARVLVLTGEGQAFCSGQDLGDAGGAEGIDLERVLREEYEPMLRAITGCTVPTIAAVNGVAAGAGANLALSADVVIAASSAFFVQSFTRIGLIPDAGGTWSLPRQIGLAEALGTALFAEPVSAHDASRMGMIWEAVPDDAFAEHWKARAETLANGPTYAYRAVKEAMRASFSNDLEAQLALEARLQGDCGKTSDFREGVAAFLQKRKPHFKGN